MVIFKRGKNYSIVSNSKFKASKEIVIFYPYYCHCEAYHIFTMLLYLIPQEKSGVPLVAHEKFSEPKEVEVLSNVNIVDVLMDIIHEKC